MITRLAIRNFKSWRNTGSVRLAPISALFGSNSSGKTSLLQMLLMLKQTTESSDRSQVLHLGDERTLVELGTFQDLVFDHDPKRSLVLELEWQLEKQLTIENPATKRGAAFQDNTLGFSATIASKTNGDQGLGRIVVPEMSYKFARHNFGMRMIDEQKSEYELFSAPSDFKFARTQGRPWNLPPPAKCYGFPDQVRAYFKNASFLSDFEFEFENLFSRTYYLGPLRDYPKREYAWSGAQPADMGRRGERVVDALLASRDAGPTFSLGPGRGKKKQTLEQRVADWLKKLGLIDSFSVRPITKGGKLFQVWVRRHTKAPEVLITDVGFGVSQILPVITLCYYVPEGSTIILEQPEIHLHPRVQAGLADVLIDATTTRNVQVILESHSEHILRRLQRRIAEEQLQSEQSALYFCASDDGESKLVSLKVDMFGTIENWPEDFFGDEFGEIAAMSTAALSRRIKKSG